MVMVNQHSGKSGGKLVRVQQINGNATHPVELWAKGVGIFFYILIMFLKFYLK